MKRALVLAYYFPPLGGAGVQRTVKLVKHLPAFGYVPVVLSAPDTTELDWAPAETGLLEELPGIAEVYRVPGPHPAAAAAWRARVDRLLDRPGPFARWWIESAVATGTPLAGRADILYASMSPFETAEAAARIASAAGIPWVADLRDPWALDEWTIYPSAIHRRRDERRMRRQLATAAAVIMNTEEARREVRRRFPELSSRLSVVPNGWDRDDLVVPAEERRDDRFRVVYAGYSHVSAGLRHRRLRRRRELLGGSVPGLDVLARSHVLLVEAMRRAAAEDPQLGERLELHVAGAAQPAGPAEPFVVDRGYLAHDAAVALMRSADVLFLPMHDVPAGTRVRTVPGKTYEYLASGRPILAALPDGDARDFLTGLPNVMLCRPTDIGAMAEALHGFFKRASTGTDPADTAREQPQTAEVAWRFERREQVKRIAEVFDRALAGQAENAG